MVGIGESFGPDRDARKLYYTYLAIPALVLGATFLAAGAVVLYFVAAPESWIAVIAMFVPYVVAVSFVAYWIPRYISTVTYTLSEDRVVFAGGLWWKRKSYVPYNRITNIDVLQGPISRRFRIGKVSIQTAGYSGQSSSGSRFAELAIFGVRNFEEIKDTVISIVTKSRPVAVEAGVEGTNGARDAEILEELKKIREGIEVISARA